jgi:hypothetical protein
LSPEELAEFHRLAKTAGESAAVHDAITGLPVASVVVWKHLPGPLYQVAHEYPGLAFASPDRVFQDIVPAAAALLAWDSLLHHSPSGPARKCLRRSVKNALEQGIARAQYPFLVGSIRTSEEVASAVLPDSWRSLVLGSPHRAAAAASHLAKWIYSTGITGMGPAWLTFRFADDQVNARIGVESIDPDVVSRVHDMLILDRLWDELGLVRTLGPSPDFIRRHIYIKHSLGVVADCSPQEVSRELVEKPSGENKAVWSALLRMEDIVAGVRLIHFLRRVAERPRVAESILGHEWRAELERLTSRAVEVEAALHPVKMVGSAGH